MDTPSPHMPEPGIAAVRKLLITGAAGNLGGMLARHLVGRVPYALHLLIHRKDVSADLRGRENVAIFRGDLAERESLTTALGGVDVVIHFAGVLFRAMPEKFLPTTNTRYFQNLCAVALEQKVRRIILVSFPHVEGESSPVSPAVGRLTATPESAHARTRLEEERHLFGPVQEAGVEVVSLRVGMVYGAGVLMIDAARWLSERRLLGVWKKETWIHLISREDFLDATRAAIERPGISGIYHLGDEGKQTLQEFLRIAAAEWGTRAPWLMPDWMIQTAACACEAVSWLFGVASPLTRDFIKIGKVSYYGDTSRMRRDLLSSLRYPTIKEGKPTLSPDAAAGTFRGV